MKLREWDWNQQAFVEIDYPDEVIQDFMNWLRTTRQWRESPDPGRDVYSKFRKLESTLAEHRNDPERAKKQLRLENLAKARAAKGTKNKQKAAAAT